MQFLYPGFLYALFLTAIPVIIHFFTLRRYKTVYFSNITWLKNVINEDRSKSKLRNILILIIRILIICALVISFSRPYIPQSGISPHTGQQTVGIYIDNSFSMESMSGDMSLLEAAKNYSIEIVNSMRPDTRFYLVTNGFYQKNQHLINQEQILDRISEIKTGPDRKTFNEVILRCTDFYITESKQSSNSLIGNLDSVIENHSIYIISDFQKNISEIIPDVIKTSVIFVPLKNTNSNNLFIDSIWFDTPKHSLNQAEIISARVRNTSMDIYDDIPVKLYLNDSLKAMASVNVKGSSSQIVELSYTNSIPGIVHGKIEINDYPVTYDNSYYFSYTVKDKISVLIINENKENKFLSEVFNVDDYFNLTNYYSDNILSYNFSNYELIILNSPGLLSTGLKQVIISYVENGGSLLFIPSAKANIQAYNSLLNRLNTNIISSYSKNNCVIESLDYDHEIFMNTFKQNNNNIQFPDFDSYYIFSSYTNRPDHILIQNDKNEKILSVSAFGTGKVFVFSVPVINDQNKFVRHPLFFPTIYNIALSSLSEVQTYYVVGTDQSVVLPLFISGSEIHLVNQSEFFDLIPENNKDLLSGKTVIELGDNLSKAGNYSAISEGIEYSGVAFNYNRLESVLEYLSEDEISELAKNNTNGKGAILEARDSGIFRSLHLMNHGRQLWSLFIILALVLLAIEILLIRIWN